MRDVRLLIFEKNLVGQALDALSEPHPPDPKTDPARTLLYGHALNLYGDFQQALGIFSKIPTPSLHDAERLWGLATAQLGLGKASEVKPLLDDAFSKRPPDWLLPRLYNTLANLYIGQGQFDYAQKAIETGIETARNGHFLTEQVILDGNRGLIKTYEGDFEEAVFLLQKAVNQLLVRNCILYAANFLVNLGSTLEALGHRTEALKCLSRAERLIQESGSKIRLVFLKQVQGELWGKEGALDKAEQAYREALELLREFPVPLLEVQLTCDLAHLRFEKGDLSEALRLVRKALAQARAKELYSLEDLCHGYEGKFLLQTGAVREGIEALGQARELAELQEKRDYFCYFALFLSLGYEELKEREQSLKWFQKSLDTAERCSILPALLVEREVLTTLLFKFEQSLPATETLSKLIVLLHHPALLKRLLRGGPGGKIHFLRSLKIHDARYYRPHLAKLKNDPDKEVRRFSRHLINGWLQYAHYKVYAFGKLRIFLEGKMFGERDWMRPGVKRLFLFFVTCPDKWHTNDAMLEALWSKPQTGRTTKVLNAFFSYLRSVFEPWSRESRPGGKYLFFQSQRGAYGFFPGERFWMDYQEFEQGIKKAEQAQFQRKFKEARKAYREALNLYLGDYLEEFPYEDFLRLKRDYLRELYFRSVLRYAKLEQDSGNLPEARRVLEEALFKDLSRSGCAAILIQVLTQMKLIQEAKEWGQRHINYMKEELKEKPAPEVVEELGKLG